ncbi:MAG: methyltransferase domain-containing protein [Acidimicrobiia bacterium]
MGGPSQGIASVDAPELEAKVKAMYRAVAEDPGGSYHFELGRELAERLGYPASTLDQIPVGAVESFAGVGYFFDLADLKKGEHVLDLGSGSGMDVLFAALQVGESGRVVGVDMTSEQLAKAERLRAEAGFEQVTFTDGHIEDLPFPEVSFDVVISNGVINLAPDKRRVFAEAARVLRPGGRLAIADIIAEVELTPQIVANTDLWASCIGGAAQQDAYQEAIEAAGLRLELMKKNRYRFLSDQAKNACQRYGVKSVSALARKPEQPTPRAAR